jgi:hypothetical protein
MPMFNQALSVNEESRMKAMPKRPDREANRCLSRAPELIHDMDGPEKEDAQRHQLIQHRRSGRPPLIDQMKQSVCGRLADEVADVFVQVSFDGLFSHECCRDHDDQHDEGHDGERCVKGQRRSKTGAGLIVPFVDRVFGERLDHLPRPLGSLCPVRA